MNARVTLVTGILTLALFVPQAVAIPGGQVDEDNTYSNVGAVVGMPPDGSGPFVGGSGILVHPRVLLTAGHVTFFMEQNPWTIPLTSISFGTDAFDPATWHEVEAVITHPNYNPNSLANDVGVIILKKPVNIREVPLANLPYEGFLDDLEAAGLLRQPSQGVAFFRVVGYGSTLDWPPRVIVPGDGWRRFADSEYLNLLPGWLHLLQNLATADGGTAVGDSGGPAFWIEPDGTRVLVALASWGEPVAMGFYWRVDIPETLAFIYWVIEEVNNGRL